MVAVVGHDGCWNDPSGIVVRGGWRSGDGVGRVAPGMGTSSIRMSCAGCSRSAMVTGGKWLSGSRTW